MQNYNNSIGISHRIQKFLQPFSNRNWQTGTQNPEKGDTQIFLFLEFSKWMEIQIHN